MEAQKYQNQNQDQFQLIKEKHGEHNKQKTATEIKAKQKDLSFEEMIINQQLYTSFSYFEKLFAFTELPLCFIR